MPKADVGSWAIRIASSPSNGRGHLTRSGALARALSEHVPVTVVLDSNGLEDKERLEGEDFVVLAADQITDQYWSGVVLDGYGFDEAEITNWRRRTNFLVTMDDFLSPHPMADLALNPAPHLSGNKIGDMPALLGANYMLLPSEYAMRPKIGAGTDGEMLIVVSFGMIDSQNATGLSISALAALRKDHSIRAIVLTGRNFPHLSAVQALAETHRDWLELRLDEQHVGDIWRRADFAIGAGGISLYERMASGCPSVCIMTAENQKLALAEMEDRGLGIFAGLIDELEPETLRQIVASVLTEKESLTAMSRAGRRLIDGQGAMRTAAALIDRQRTHARERRR